MFHLARIFQLRFSILLVVAKILLTVQFAAVVQVLELVARNKMLELPVKEAALSALG